MNQLKRFFFLMLILMIVTISQLWSGTTGKIAGIITDKATGETLIGANIVVVGTSLGGVTDVNGQYTILYLPPGTYKVQISFIGYKTIVVNDARVFIDQTTRVDIALEPQAIEVGETIIIAERNIIKADVATSVVDVSVGEVMNLPATNIQNVLDMQAGIKDGKIRGSDMDQSLFLLDGVTMRDPRNNQAIIKVALSSVKELSLERGGFNAEYGQVQSGITKVVTNEGKQKGYSGSFMVSMSPPAAKYFQGNGSQDVHDPNSYWMRPFLDPAVCWTGTNNGAWDKYTRDHYLTFEGWNAISQQKMRDNDPNNDLTPQGAQRAFEYETRKRQINNQPDYNIDAGFGGPVPLISEALGNLRFFASYRSQRDMLLFPMTRPDYSDYDGRLVVTANLTKSMTLRVSALAGNIATMEDNWNKGSYPHWPYEIAGGTGGSSLFNMFSDWTYSLTDIDHRSLSAKITHTLGPKTLYEFSVEYFRRNYFSRPPARRDTSIVTEVVPGFYESSNPYGYYPSATSSDGVIIYAGEQQSLARDNSAASSTTVKFDITSQVDFSNEVKAGVEFVYNDLSLDYGFIQMQTDGKSYASRVLMRNYPVRGAAYLQDKLETQGFTLNAGLRLDYSNSNTDWWAFDPYNLRFIGEKYSELTPYRMTTAKGQWQLSPRLGISHPITENSKLYFNYGHFKQMPQYEAAFRFDRRNDNTLARLGDPNQILAKTISYELGYDHQLFGGELLLQVAAFYRDISDQSNQTTYNPIIGKTYSLTTSNGYSDIRGFELTLRKSVGRWFYGFVNYTYQATSNGNFDLVQKYEDPFRQTTYKDDITNANNIYQTHNVPSPFARANLNFSTPEDFGPRILEHSILGDFMVSLLLNWSQGGWTTYNPQKLPGVVNNIQFVDSYDGTLRASKSFVFTHFNIQLFADISNLFNLRRLNNTDDRAYRESLHLPTSDAYPNIPGDDKFGDYRKPGVEWQPTDVLGSTTKLSAGTRAYYYEYNTGQYWHYTDDQSIPMADRWTLVDPAKVNQMIEDKAYINMPNPSTFWFLNPRNITYGLRVSFDLD
jgi:outer membrane receptor protein involved in Fe transport